MAGHKLKGTCLWCMEDKFLMQAIHEHTRGEALLDMLLTSEEELLDDAKFKGNLAYSNQETVDLKILRGLTKRNRMTAVPDFPDILVSLGTYLLGRTSWGTAPECTGSQESWLTFKDRFIIPHAWSLQYVER